MDEGLFEEEEVPELEYLDDLVLEDLPSIEVIKEEKVKVEDEKDIFDSIVLGAVDRFCGL